MQELAGKNFTSYVGPPPNEITSCRVTLDTRSTQTQTRDREERKRNFEKSKKDALYREQ